MALVLLLTSLGLWACVAAAPPAEVSAPAEVLPTPPAAAPPSPVVEAPPLAVTERLLPFDAERVALTLAYRAEHQGQEFAQDVHITPQVIVLHWTGGPTAESAWQTFAPARLAGRPELQGGGALNVSAHYLIDRDGSITRLLPDDVMARHAIGLNHAAIGVENVGGGDRWPLTEAQVTANVRLVRSLVAKHPGITHLYGHHEVAGLRGAPIYLELDANYTNQKADPGPEFMAAVRAGVAGLGLAP
jgi:N-acetylmuramoyl-L-alanine amidase